MSGKLALELLSVADGSINAVNERGRRAYISVYTHTYYTRIVFVTPVFPASSETIENVLPTGTCTCVVTGVMSVFSEEHLWSGTKEINGRQQRACSERLRKTSQIEGLVKGREGRKHYYSNSTD